jgi:multiple sugar transport system ATP-binding protein
VVNDLDPKDRDIAMVFQNYALYPQKSVYKNLAFPLLMRKLPRDEIDRKIMEAARVLDMTQLLERRRANSPVGNSSEWRSAVHSFATRRCS